MIKQLSIILILVLLKAILVAQKNYVHFTVKDGLPQMQCMKLFQDSKGYIWIGTKGGISRYDGISFKNYNVDNGLGHNHVRAIAEDKHGHIWALTRNGLSVLKNDQFYFQNTKNEIIINTGELVIDGEGNMWIIGGTYRNKLIRFSKSKYTVVFWGEERKGYLSGLSFDEKTKKIFVTCCKDKGSVLHSFYKNVHDSTVYKNSIFIVKHKEKCAIKKTICESTSKVESAIFSLSDNDTTALANYNDHVELLTRLNDSTLIFTGSLFNAQMPVNYLVNAQLKEDPAKFDQINDILHDSEGNVWLASEKGLLKLTPFYNYSKDDNMPDYVWMIQEDIAGRIWFASYNNMFLYYIDNGTIHKFSQKFQVGGFFLGGTKTQSGDIIFSYNSGVQKFNRKSFEHLKFPISAATLSVFEDTLTRKLYFGTYAGLYIMDKKGLFELNTRFRKNKDEIILQIVKNKKNELWFVTRKSYGILNRPDTLVRHNDAIKGAMCLYCDYKNNLWIGTDNGLFFYNYQDFIEIGHPELKTMIGSIVEVDSTHLVYGGLRGIGVLDLMKFYEIYEKKQIESTEKKNVVSSASFFIQAESFVDYYTQSHGFLGEEIGQNGIFKDSKGTIWVPTNSNVVKFHPSDLKRNNKTPYVYITNIQVSEDHIIWKSINNKTELKHSLTNIRFDFIGICHTAPDMVKYKYRLKGFSDEWGFETKDRSVTYTNLTPGEYTFELFACNNNGVWIKQPVSHSFVIMAAWWQTLWFKTLAVIIIFCITFISIRLFYRRKVYQAELSERLNNLQIQSMQSQLYPHLLFNTASAAGSVIYKENKDKAYDFVVKLSQFMRMALDGTKKFYRSLKEELNFVEKYLEIQKIRFPERFSYQLKIDNTIDLSMQVPQMILQTYVENSIKYGLEPLKEGGILKIELSKLDNETHLIVEDNGVGIKVGLKNKEKGTGSGINIMNEIYEIHNQRNKNKISFELIDLHKKGEKGTISKVTIRMHYKKK